MFSNRLAFALLAAACVGAAAGGGYFASRQSAPVSVAAAVRPTEPAAAPSAASAPNSPVQETEAVIGDRSDKSSSAPKTGAASLPAASSTMAGSVPATSVKRPAPAAATSTIAGGASARSTSREPAAAADANARHETAERIPQAPPAPAPPAANGAGASSPTSSAAPGPEASTAQAAPPDDRAPAEPKEPPAKTFDELVVSSDSVIGLQTENTVTSDSARIEDRVDAHVTRDVRVGDRVAIPAGTRAIGSVTLVERGGKFKERARLGIRFHTLVLADGTRVPISTETITRDGDPPTSAAKIGGGAVGGAIIGAILGGAKGAAIGGATGAGAGAAAVAAGDRNSARLPAGTQTSVRVLSPVTVTVEK
jgi:hypothetical protein